MVYQRALKRGDSNPRFVAFGWATKDSSIRACAMLGLSTHATRLLCSSNHSFWNRVLHQIRPHVFSRLQHPNRRPFGTNLAQCLECDREPKSVGENRPMHSSSKALTQDEDVSSEKRTSRQFAPLCLRSLAYDYDVWFSDSYMTEGFRPNDSAPPVQTASSSDPCERTEPP